MRLLAAALLAWQAGDEAVAREWRVRAWAREPSVHAAALAQDLAAASWRARATALDALHRAAEAGRDWAPEQSTAVLRALSDAHPNVRARALDAARACALPLARECAAALAVDPVGSVRLALARALEFCASSERARLLCALAEDADERVRAAARLALTGLDEAEAGVRAARLEALSHAHAEGLEPFGRFLLGLAGGPLSAETLGAARALVAPDVLALGWLEALSFARLGGGDGAALAACARLDEAWEGAGARLLERARLAHSLELASALLGSLAGLEPGVARRALVGLLVDSVEPEAPAFLAAQSVTDEVLVECLAALALRRDTWREDEWAPWTDPTTPCAVRRAAQRALAGAYARAGDPGAGRGLIAFLADPEASIAASAFEALCAAHEPRVDDGAPLARAFDGLPPGEKLRRAQLFTRARVFPALRSQWIELGAGTAESPPPGEARLAACELLAGFEGDEEARAPLSRWFAADLARFAAGAEATAERLVQAELRALARVSRGEALAQFQAGLEAALGRSTEVGKVACAALGRSQAGRAFLAECLRAGQLDAQEDRRTRIEACIVLARGAAPRDRALAVTRLVADRTGAAWDLRQRMLEALAESGVPAAEEALLALAGASELESVERVTVTTLLAAHGGEQALAVLGALARNSFDLETRRVAVAALAGCGAEAALAELWAELASGKLAAGPEELALLRGDLLLARARLDPGPGVCAEWLRAPLASAAADLARRFQGEELPAPEFRWRHELELARVLPASGSLEACLEASADLGRLDARTLLALAEATLAAGQAAAAEELFALAAIGLLGERDPDPDRLAWILARQLTRARTLGPFDRASVLQARVDAARRAGALTEAQWDLLFPLTR